MRCPKCSEESFPKKKLITDGWKVIGEIEVCALCGAELKSSPSEEKSDVQNISSDAADRLSALLGVEKSKKVVLAGSEDRRFCRNCRHFIVHPFKNVCALSDKEADPMGECSLFAAKDL